jgi:archaellum biogenesis ATPase FlaH
MSSILVLTSVENLQDEITAEVMGFNGKVGIYVSMNKTQRSTEELLKKGKISTERLFFIDCVTTEKTRDDVLHVSPEQLDLLATAISAFIHDIPGEKFLIIDALSTLLIYNNENKVAKFVKEVTETAARKDVQVIAFSPKTQEEELLQKIFNFFDKVEKRK